MTLLNDIADWVGTLKCWQQESMRRIFSPDGLTAADVARIRELILADGTPQAAAVPAFTLPDIPGVAGSDTVRLQGVKRLERINGFPDGRFVTFRPDGMTVLFGHNGAGKSGCARLLKRACRARHRADILPNAFVDPTPSPEPSAHFDLLVSDAPATVTWTQNAQLHADLEAISVCDVACAADYIDAEGTPAFQPYGLPQVTKLALFQRDLQITVEAERGQLVRDRRPFAAMHGDTEVGNFIAGLNEDSDLAVVDALATLTPEDAERVAFLTTALAESDPTPRAMALEQLAKRLEAGSALAVEIQGWVNDQGLAHAQALRRAEQDTLQAMAATRDRLHGRSAEAEAPGASDVLAGTGDALWQAMYRAAEDFSASVYADHSFPHVDDGAVCVLCQQTYAASAVERMRRFETFVADAATDRAREASRARKEALRKVRDVATQLFDAPTLTDIQASRPVLHEAVAAAVASWGARHAWLLSGLESDTWPVAVTELPDEAMLDEALISHAKALRVDAEMLRASVNPQMREKLRDEKAQLEDRGRLSEHRAAVETFIENSKKYAALDRCVTALNPQSVSRKLTALAATHVTQALADAVNAELKALGYGRRIQPELSGRTALGVTKVTLNLKGAAAKSSRILSEGEQRVMGLAMFLAEIEAQPTKSTVVFDDPATSMDHVYRRAIARRLVRLAADRQVLVFTHDAVFLTELAEALRTAGQEASYKTIERDDGPGMVRDGLTWATMDTGQRMNDLTQRVSALRAADAPVGDALERQISQAYTSLRGTVERAIREIFLNKTVQPFSDVVSVEAFGAVIGHPQDEWIELKNLYSRACEATEAHDTPGERQQAVPSVEELCGDIALLERLIANAGGRKRLYDKQRSLETSARKNVF
jgi:energy-coupling factor transporter ATP-binding protein EcfA2